MSDECAHKWERVFGSNVFRCKACPAWKFPKAEDDQRRPGWASNTKLKKKRRKR